jgi:hypothetical protein
MAATERASHLIDLDLDGISIDITGLSGFAEDWDHLEDGVRASFSLGWDQSMAILRSDLDPAYRSGAMVPHQQARYRKLLRILSSALADLERMGLQCPSISLEP